MQAHPCTSEHCPIIGAQLETKCTEEETGAKPCRHAQEGGKNDVPGRPLGW